jgi:phospholipase/carboxylesterase
VISDPHRDQPVLASGRPLDSASGAVILIHGRGASASDILGLAEKLYHPELAYLAPEAAGHSWYPHSFLAPIGQNEPWLTSALGVLNRLVERAAQAGISRQKLIVAGFSQGACLATEFVARNPARYGALISLTGGLIGPPGTKFKYEGDLAGTPAFLGAGDPDPHVPWDRVKESASVLSALGANVTLRRHPNLPHTINEDEIEEAGKLVQGVMTSKQATSRIVFEG